MKAKYFAVTALASAVFLSACDDDRNPFLFGQTEPLPANVLVSGNKIAFLNANSPANSLDILGDLTGVVAGDTLVSLDRRPQTGYLYALGYNAANASLRVYVVHPDSLVATPLGTTPITALVGDDPIGGGSASTRFEIDFNPAVDRLRVVSSLGENYRLNPNNGTLVARDGDTKIGAAGPLTPVYGTAYTNNQPNTAATTQYTANEGNNGSLFIQNPPNDGVLTDAKALTPSINTLLGLDIAPGVDAASASQPATGLAYALVKTTATGNESIARINLQTGAVTNMVSINQGSDTVGLALQKPLAMPVIALSGDGTQLLRFQANNPGTVQIVDITGITADESLVGIDIRPATGELFALGVNVLDNNATLYRLDPQLGAATVIGIAGGISDAAVIFPDPTIEGYGVDFNPTVDRIRVTASNGVNLRLNPLNGQLGAIDGDINGASNGASAAAYTNSVATDILAMGAAAKITTLYVLDDATSQLTIQAPPNDGTQADAKPLTLNGNPLTFTNSNGFDIPSDVRVTANNAPVSSGAGYAALTVAGVTGLYRINLVNGNTESLGNIGSGNTLRGLAVGQTHAK